MIPTTVTIQDQPGAALGNPTQRNPGGFGGLGVEDVCVSAFALCSVCLFDEMTWRVLCALAVVTCHGLVGGVGK